MNDEICLVRRVQSTIVEMVRFRGDASWACHAYQPKAQIFWVHEIGASLSLSLPACLPYSSVVRTEIPEKNVQDDRFGNVRNGVLLGKVKLQGCQVVVVLSFCVQGRGGK